MVMSRCHERAVRTAAGRGAGARLSRWSRCLLAAVALWSVAAQAARDDQLKAAFVYNFTRFIEWPADAFAGDDAPIVIGVYANSRYARELEDTVRVRKAGNRPVVVRQVRSLKEARAVHMLVFDGTADAQLKEALAALKGAPVLTIGESEQFARLDGILTFVREGDDLRFEVNLDAARQSGLKISAQFLKLARTVRKPR